MIGYRSVLSSGGGDPSAIRDAFRYKVFNTENILTFPIVQAYNRTQVHEGQVICDTSIRTVWLYVDFSMQVSLDSNDWYTMCFITGFTDSYFPKRKTSYPDEQNLATDPSSSVPSRSFFIQNHNGINIHKGQSLSVGNRFYVYGSWQY